MVEKEILYYESNEVTLMVLDILLTLECLWKLLPQYCHSNGEDIDILIEILSCLIVLMLIQLLGGAVIVLRIKQQPIHLSQCPIVLTDCILAKRLE